MADHSKIKKNRNVLKQKVKIFFAVHTLHRKQCCHLPGVDSGRGLRHPPLRNGSGLGGEVERLPHFSWILGMTI